MIKEYNEPRKKKKVMINSNKIEPNDESLNAVSRFTPHSLTLSIFIIHYLLRDHIILYTVIIRKCSYNVYSLHGIPHLISM